MREIKFINNDWLFEKEGKGENVNLPHTWNGIDGQDGGNDYYRGTCCYTKVLGEGDFPKGDEVYVQFDGVNSSAKVYFNGTQIAKHDGGYSTFRAKIPTIKESNEIKVEVDNSPNETVYPQNADFTFYGGIYRDVSLVGVNKAHFDLDYYGAPGIMVTPIVNEKDANVEITAFVACGEQKNFDVVFELYDDKLIATQKAKAQNEDDKITFQANFEIKNAHLWHGVADPHLYLAKAKIVKDDVTLDEVEARFGCRSFEINPEKGFILNGESYPLRGVSRHQDRPKIGNALLKEHHKEDIDLITEMGANSIRLAHYQHNQYFYDLCDEKGIVVWAEIPYISNHLKEGVENTKQQMTELITQNYNHPSIVVWGLSNEISMGGITDDITQNHVILNDLAHSLDKTRPTTVAVLSMCSPEEPYLKISDVLAYNHYFGWYGGNVNMYGTWFDEFHKKYPNRAVGISEYGAEALNWHATEITQGDYTEEYQAFYHEEVIKQIMERPYLWSTYVWNMFDFGADNRAEGGENGLNHKGLVTFDRKYKKDAFYAYKAWLNPEPMVHIAGKRYIKRCEARTKITVYSNQNEVELFVNGKSAGKQQRGKYPFFYFEIDNIGESALVAKAYTASGEITDTALIEKVDVFNEDYRMKDQNAVINWFEITMPEGRYNINDTIGDVLKTFGGKMAILKIFKLLSKSLKGNGEKKKAEPSEKEKSKKKGKGVEVMGMKLDKNMMEIAKGFSLKRAFSMIGAKFTKEQLLEVNSILNKAKKPKK